MLTVLTVFSTPVVTLIILVPARPSRENVISMPSVRRNVCARRSRPASARGFLAHALPLEMSSRALSAHPEKYARGHSEASTPFACVGGMVTMSPLGTQRKSLDWIPRLRGRGRSDSLRGKLNRHVSPCRGVRGQDTRRASCDERDDRLAMQAA